MYKYKTDKKKMNVPEKIYKKKKYLEPCNVKGLCRL